MQDNRPRARKKYIGSSSSPAPSGGNRAGTGGGGGMLKIIIAIIVALVGGGGSLGGLLGGSSDGVGSLFGGSDYFSPISAGSGTSSGWSSEANVGTLNTEVSSLARDKLTTIKGNGNDQVTIMMYMCGTDLESRSAMATRDLQEMLSASVTDKVNLIIYTGGCSQWRNTSISNKCHQVWQIKNGKLSCLKENAGSGAMTDASHLASFIQWTNKNFPANRRELIFWDHGGGSLSGYGYDEQYSRSGSMTLENIDAALESAGVTFDFVGFDACLMATAETALMLGKHADYLIGSEETEPGIGWYYTNWLTKLSADPSMATLQVGKQIADDFTAACSQQCAGQQTTLSVVDLAEVSQTLPDVLSAFSEDASQMIQDGSYKEIATARSSSQEFARSSGIDQVDLVHFADLLGTSAGRNLATTLRSAIKYNRTSSNIANAYGLSIYFPYRKLSGVDSIANTYRKIGMDASYSNCIKKFAQMQVSGQAVAGGSTTSSPLGSLLGASSGGYSSYHDSMTGQMASTLISSLLGGRNISNAGLDDLDDSNARFMSDSQLQADSVAETVSRDRITESDMTWRTNQQGKNVITLTEDQWSLVTAIDMGVFYDTGDGYLDLGLDNVYTFDEDGNMVPETDETWLAINGQVVRYVHDTTLEQGGGRYSIIGHVPVNVNDKRADLVLVFDQDHEQGYVAGVRYEYDDAITETTAKTDAKLSRGDQIRFLYDVYDESGNCKENQAKGDTLTVTDSDALSITNVNIDDGLADHGVIKSRYADADRIQVTYRFTDVYGQMYWTQRL